MTASAVAGGAVAAAGGFALPAVLDHASDDQADHSQQDGKNQNSSHKNQTFLKIEPLGGGTPSPAFVRIYTLAVSLSASL